MAREAWRPAPASSSRTKWTTSPSRKAAANWFELIGSSANAVPPGKRMLSSMSTTFLESERGLAILGTPGGSRIITMVLLAALE
jgi:gamma-glutamyltranspeptidase/glutathione hydrolase